MRDRFTEQPKLDHEPRKQRVLCICEQGNCRSVALAFVLRRNGYEALPVGVMNSSDDTQAMLFNWADRIIFTTNEPTRTDWPEFQGQLTSVVPPEHQDKVSIWDVGPDDYFYGWKNNLCDKYREFLRAEGKEEIR